ncbi:MAG: PRC-barrel domain-containing protein [Cyanobacteria bacterium P01_F01_bin.150]
MTSEQSFQRSDIIGTQVITQDSGKRLGVVSQMWIDIDRREVVALGIQDNIVTSVVSNIEQTMLMSDVQQIGDVVLVADDSVLDDDVDVERYSNLVNCEVITETGEMLGKVRGFRMDPKNGKIISLMIASLGIPRIPDQLISTYELSIDEIVSSGPDRLIVFEGAEQKMNQVTVGILERLGIGTPPWDKDIGYKTMPVDTPNQLGTGSQTTAPPVVQEAAAEAAQETWDEDNWNEPQGQPLEEVLQQREMAYEEADNWTGNTLPQEASFAEESPYEEYATQADSPYESYDGSGDPWGDDENPKPYQPQKLNIPEKKKVIEYEEETDY